MPELSIPSFFTLLYSAYLLVFMEGLFFFTRPNFVSSADSLETLSALFASIPFVWLPGLLLWGLCVALELLMSRFKKVNAQVSLIPTLLCLTLIAVLMVDNFSYTVFKLGIMHVRGFLRYLCVILILAVFAALYWKIAKTLRRNPAFFRHPAFFFTAGLPLTISVFVVLGKLLITPAVASASESGARTRSDLPNIILFASDGIDANRLALYGYHRNTTPSLNAFSKERPPLLCENAFSNGARTTGSVTSMLTGKAPATNKVFFPPHMLDNAESHRHLPGLLKKLGYVNFQETIRYYADAGDLNLQGAFDIANNRSLYSAGFLGRYFVAENYFLTSVLDRIRQRSLHLVGLRPMEDVSAQMTRRDKPKEVYGTNDDTRMERFFKFMETTKTPFFAHLHLLDSHCCGYKFRRVVFSARNDDDDEGASASDLMDDTILSSDDNFGRMLEFLKARGMLANTLIVYSSDHNRGWTIKKRTPLMFFFPEGKRARVEERNCQLLDIMPTILDALGRKLPPWLEGRSLLRPEQLTNDRPIFGFLNISRRATKVGASTVTTLTDAGPPFYGLTSYGMVSCDRWYELNLNHGRISSGLVAGHSGDCADVEDLQPAEARREIVKYLKAKKLGFKFKDAG
jgi:arylsulfatase A-like enzyme